MLVVFLVALVLAMLVSLARPAPAERNRISGEGVSYATSTGFNIGALGVILILVALYATWW
jgi:SSS family solute:Na+ symporter